jgi:hypothetical protein
VRLGKDQKRVIVEFGGDALLEIAEATSGQVSGYAFAVSPARERDTKSGRFVATRKPLVESRRTQVSASVGKRYKLRTAKIRGLRRSLRPHVSGFFLSEIGAGISGPLDVVEVIGEVKTHPVQSGSKLILRGNLVKPVDPIPDPPPPPPPPPKR